MFEPVSVEPERGGGSACRGDRLAAGEAVHVDVGLDLASARAAGVADRRNDVLDAVVRVAHTLSPPLIRSIVTVPAELDPRMWSSLGFARFLRSHVKVKSPST